MYCIRELWTIPNDYSLIKKSIKFKLIEIVENWSKSADFRKMRRKSLEEIDEFLKRDTEKKLII